jgi:hypothetical protein
MSNAGSGVEKNADILVVIILEEILHFDEHNRDHSKLRIFIRCY